MPGPVIGPGWQRGRAPSSASRVQRRSGTTTDDAAPQLTLDDLSPLLHDVTFIVVDVETTGMSPADDRLTEIGAIKVRGGEVLGEFSTLINPGRPIPPTITRLTSITETMVAPAPPESSVLPAFLEFFGPPSESTVFVAHNARFDHSFLQAACTRCGLGDFTPPVLCTLTLARRVIPRTKLRSHSLASLSRYFHATTPPIHRALDDARATVDVLHGLIEHTGRFGPSTLAELSTYRSSVSHAVRRKKSLADGLPHAPGVYLFRGPAGETLYIGTATDLRRRVSSYFSDTDTRKRIQEMVQITERVDHIVCTHALQAQVRELALIRAHTPPYNRSARQQQAVWWIGLHRSGTALTPTRAAGRRVLGPFRTRSEARAAIELLVPPPSHSEDHIPTVTPGDCAASLQHAVSGETDAACHAARARVTDAAAAGRYETASLRRDEAAHGIASLARRERLHSFVQVPRLDIAQPDGRGGWNLSIIRYGRLAAVGVAPRGTRPYAVLKEMALGATHVTPPTYRQGHGDLASFSVAEDGWDSLSITEVALLYRVVTDGSTRLVHINGEWTEPARSAGPHDAWARRAQDARRTARTSPD